MSEYSQTYWNELIDKYRDGSISDQDRYQLEKQALDDPFLFDALEGFSLYEHAANGVKAEQKKKSILTLPRIAAAASIILIVAFLFTLKFNSSSNLESDNSIAMVLETDDVQENIPVEDAIKDYSLDQNFPSSTTAERITFDESKPKPSKVDVVVRKRKEAIEIAEETRVKESSKSSDAVNNSRNKEVEKGPEVIIAKDDIIDENKESVVVSVESEDLVVPAPHKRNYEKVEEEIVAIDSGIKKQTKNKEGGVPISSDKNSFLEQSAKEKVVLGSLKVYEAAPVIGKKIFDEYAKERIDDRGLRQTKPQEVTIEFTIDENGNLTNFHHIFTGCSECGPFAISILQNSGEWRTVPPGFSGKARYTFIF